MIIPTLSNVTRPKSQGYDGSIGNVLIRLAVSPQTPFEDLTAEATAPRVDTAASAEDMRDEVGRRYSRSKLLGGAGLDFLHTPDRSDDADVRFWDSRHVDVFREKKGDIYEVPLMHAMEGQDVTGTILSVFAHDGTVYYALPDGVYDLATKTNRYALDVGVMALSMGSSIYALDSDGVTQIDPSDWSASVLIATVYDRIYAVKSRIVGVTDNILYDASNMDAVILTLPADDTLNDVVDAGPVVLALATTGSIHSLNLDNSLDLVPIAETKFTGEVPILAAEAFGVLGFATTESTEVGGKVARFYTGSLVAGNAVGDISLVFTVGDRDTVEDLSPLAMTQTRDSIYIAIPEEGEQVLTVWRYYLPTGGYARGHEVEYLGNVEESSSSSASSSSAPAPILRGCTGLVEVDDRMYVGTDEEAYRESDDYEAEGWLIGPAADFFTADPKQWVSAELSGSRLPSGTELELYDTVDITLMSQPLSVSWRLVARLFTAQDQTRIDSLTNRNSRFHVCRVVWRSSSDRGSSPAFRSYSVRSLPNPTRDVLLRIPINVSDQIESQGRRATLIPGRGAATEAVLRGFEGVHTLIEIYRPAWRIRGTVERFEGTIPTISNRGSVRAVMYARIRGTVVTELESSAYTSNASLGQDTLGVDPLGVGEVNQ